MVVPAGTSTRRTSKKTPPRRTETLLLVIIIVPLPTNSQLPHSTVDSRQHQFFVTTTNHLYRESKMECPALKKLEPLLDQAKGLVFDCDGTLL